MRQMTDCSDNGSYRYQLSEKNIHVSPWKTLNCLTWSLVVQKNGGKLGQELNYGHFDETTFTRTVLRLLKTQPRIYGNFVKRLTKLSTCKTWLRLFSYQDILIICMGCDHQFFILQAIQWHWLLFKYKIKSDNRFSIV